MNFVLERLKVQVLCLFGTLNAKKWANSPRFLSVRLEIRLLPASGACAAASVETGDSHTS